MQVIKEMEVSKQELYNYIYKMICEDVKGSIDKVNAIGAGFSYRKQLQNRIGKPVEVTTTIQELEMGKYVISLESVQGINMLSYTYSEIDEEKVKVVYEESFDGVNSSGSINHSIMSFFTRRANKKRINDVLSQLEALIIQER